MSQSSTAQSVKKQFLHAVSEAHFEYLVDFEPRHRGDQPHTIPDVEFFEEELPDTGKDVTELDVNLYDLLKILQKANGKTIFVKYDNVANATVRAMY